MISKNLSENEIPSPGGKKKPTCDKNVFLSLSICEPSSKQMSGTGMD